MKCQGISDAFRNFYTSSIVINELPHADDEIAVDDALHALYAFLPQQRILARTNSI